MEYTKEQLKEKYLNLPEDLKEALMSIETAKKVKEICDKYKLRIDQSGNLANEIGLVMIGATSYREFTEAIKYKLRLTGDQAESIAHDTNIKIFSKIRSLLKEHQLERILADAPEVKPETKTEEKDTAIDPPTAIKASLFEQKMGSLYNIPKEDIEVGKNERLAPRPFDPYREQV